jgi:hypothetical protein
MIGKTLAWFLVTFYTGSATITYSPPLVSEQDCIKLKSIVSERQYTKLECIQLNTFVVGNK